MAYILINWENDPESQTPVSAENLNHMDQGIYEAYVQSAIASSSAIAALSQVQELLGLRYAPIPVSTASAMTDHNKIYVYIGNESGMQNNYWYYWNGSAWVAGGLYNAQTVTIDSTLQNSGEAADAKAVGDAIKNFGGIVTHLFTVNTGMTISSAVEIAFILFQTANDDSVVGVNGLVSGTISANGTTVTITIKVDGVTAFTFSQICNAGANAIPINAGVMIEDAGNHIVSVECSATSGTFAI